MNFIISTFQSRIPIVGDKVYKFFKFDHPIVVWVHSGHESLQIAVVDFDAKFSE
jgi:hypothetical protein